MIETREQIGQAIKWAKYPPEGARGVGYSRANLFGKQFDSYFCSIDEELLIVAQIESVQAVRNLDGIFATRGVDALIVGPCDLSASMGLTDQFDHPGFQQVLATIKTKAREHDIPMVLHIVRPDIKLLQAKIAEGYRFIAYGVGAVFLYRFAANPLDPDIQQK